jgi:hypothetical protein
LKTQQTRLNEAIVAGLKGIGANKAIPGKQGTFNTSVTTVTRASNDPGNDKFPYLYFSSATLTSRHLLADIRQATMKGSVIGLIYANLKSGNPTPAADLIDGLRDDTSAVLTLDPKWGGLARRTRIISESHSPEVEEPQAAFVTEFEIDFIEMNLDNAPATPAPGFNANGQIELSVSTSLSLREQSLNRFWNSMFNTTGVVWVEMPTIWPMPYEQIPQTHTPGVFFKDTGETFEYRGSTATFKIINISLVILVVESDETNFVSTQEGWVATIKQQLGNATTADLGGIINTVDIKEIRSDKSEYPLVHLEFDLAIRYVQSFVLA